MKNIFDSLKPSFKGDIEFDEKTLTTYSHDASLFEIKPKVVIFPKDSEDIKTLIKWVNEFNLNIEAQETSLSITPRSAGTDMSGGAIGKSIILDVTRYMNSIVEVTESHAVVMPGCLYKDFDIATKKSGSYMPAFTASRETNAMGGMVGNQCLCTIYHHSR